VLYQTLVSLVPLLGEEAEVIEEAYWINNPRLWTQFKVFLDCITAKHSLNPSEFNSQGWKYASVDHDLKTEYTTKLNDRLTLASNIFNRIAKNGFGALASVDPEWYGQGIYFTSKMAPHRMWACVPIRKGTSENRVTEGTNVTTPLLTCQERSASATHCGQHQRTPLSTNWWSLSQPRRFPSSWFTLTPELSV